MVVLKILIKGNDDPAPPVVMVSLGQRLQGWFR